MLDLGLRLYRDQDSRLRCKLSKLTEAARVSGEPFEVFYRRVGCSRLWLFSQKDMCDGNKLHN